MATEPAWVVLMTGAASGIGRATARLLARGGAEVICADHDVAGATAVAEAIGAEGGLARAVALDVTSEAAWAAVVGPLARLDVLVNCAGVSSSAALLDVTLAERERTIGVNLTGAMLGTQAALRKMVTHADKAGAIINVASASGVKPSERGGAAYAVSKAGLIMLTKASAAEARHAGLGVRVNAVSPGGVKTGMWSTMPWFKGLVEKHGSEEAAFAALAGAGKRFAEPEEVAGVIAFLAGEAGRFANGANWVMDDGYSG